MTSRNRTLSYPVCLTLVTALLGFASTQKREDTGECLDDSAITTKVEAAFFGEPSLNVFRINFETFKGEVRLGGFVDSAQSVKKAGEVARGVKGVISVKNDLIVRSRRFPPVPGS